MTTKWMTAVGVAVALAAAGAGLGAQGAGGPRFEVSFAPAAHGEPVTGRAYVMVAPTNEQEPRLQIGRTGSPFWGRDVDQLAPGAPVVLDDQTAYGAPVASMADLPAGDYFVQAFVNVYSEFRRADGHVVWMHDDQWEGQHWNRSPGNMYSAVQKVHIDPAAGGTIRLVADKVIPPVVVPPDTEWVQRIKIQSDILTKFWGRPIYLG
ncbi:MAG: hypothetical protein AB7N90_17420, partial [Vicinamibacterales bacterium]